MKKIYIAPELLVVGIRYQSFIALSFDKNDVGADENVVLTKEQTDAGWNTNNNSIWDDEW